jgi:hypothetical protein
MLPAPLRGLGTGPVCAETLVFSYWSQTRSFGRMIWAMQDIYLIIRFTRHWIHYGLLAHVLVCTLIGAVEGVLGR